MYKKEKEFTHQDCFHYRNGFCNLNYIPVDPLGSICQRFTPKMIGNYVNTKDAPLGEYKSPEVPTAYSLNPNRGSMGLNRNRRGKRRLRGRR